MSDPELFSTIEKENKRQEQEIELIASENITSLAVMQAQGSVMTNKYAEGYSGKRYYGGCEFVDLAEDLAIKRIKELLIVNSPMFNQILESSKPSSFYVFNETR